MQVKAQVALNMILLEDPSFNELDVLVQSEVIWKPEGVHNDFSHARIIPPAQVSVHIRFFASALLQLEPLMRIKIDKLAPDALQLRVIAFDRQADSFVVVQLEKGVHLLLFVHLLKFAFLLAKLKPVLDPRAHHVAEICLHH